MGVVPAAATALQSPTYAANHQLVGTAVNHFADNTHLANDAYGAVAVAPDAAAVADDLYFSLSDLLYVDDSTAACADPLLPSMPSLQPTACHSNISPILGLIPSLLKLGSDEPSATDGSGCIAQPVAKYTIHHTELHQRPGDGGLTNLGLTRTNLVHVSATDAQRKPSPYTPASLVYKLMPNDYHLYASEPGTEIGQSKAEEYGVALADVMGYPQMERPQQEQQEQQQQQQQALVVSIEILTNPE